MPGTIPGLVPGSLAEAQWYQQQLWPVVLGPIEATESDPIERIFRLLDWYREGMVKSGCITVVIHVIYPTIAATTGRFLVDIQHHSIYRLGKISAADGKEEASK